MNLKEIKEIVSLMNENELTEIEVEREGSKLKIRKSSSDEGQPVVRLSPERPALPVQPAPAPEALPSGGNQKSKDIVSPMVGTFYRAPSPEAPPFVDVGEVVEVGQIVCIVEAMKLMNEIKSEVRGKILSVPAENAEPVEFGQTLFVVEPM